MLFRKKKKLFRVALMENSNDPTIVDLCAEAVNRLPVIFPGYDIKIIGRYADLMGPGRYAVWNVNYCADSRMWEKELIDMWSAYVTGYIDGRKEGRRLQIDG